MTESQIRPIYDSSLFETVTRRKMLIATVTDKCHLTSIVGELSKKLPLHSNFTFLKRIRDRDIILGPKEDWQKIQQNFQQLNRLENFRELEVPGQCPQSRAQFTQAKQLWPCSLRLNRHFEHLVTSAKFSAAESQRLTKWMRFAIALATRLETSSVAVIVTRAEHDICFGIGWDCRRSNPLKHAVMTAIDQVAGNQGFRSVWRTDPVRSQVDAVVLNCEEFGDLRFEWRTGVVDTKTRPFESIPYLCTGYDCFVTREPCLMCAMALVHSRIGRVFFGAWNRQNGALDSKCHLHFVSQLNHHFQVFGGLLESQCCDLSKNGDVV